MGINQVGPQDGAVTYGKITLPEGTKLEKEVVIFKTNGLELYDKKPSGKRTACKAHLPNGVDVTLWKEQYAGKGEIKIDGDKTIFNRVDYKSITGTDGDDHFEFKNYNFNEFGNDHYWQKDINTKNGNDTLSGDVGLWNSHCHATTNVSSEGNLKIDGNATGLNIRTEGELDLSKVKEFEIMGTIEGRVPKK